MKAWCTDRGVEVASLGIQVHGGMGFVEETGAAQVLRDARIAPIYEGTNGIQAIDLVGRKLMRDGGATMRALIETMRGMDADLAGAAEDVSAIQAPLAAGVAALAAATDWMVGASRGPAALVGATNYLGLAGYVIGGWLMARSAIAASSRQAAGTGNSDFLTAKIRTARFYAEQVLPLGTALLGPITSGGCPVMEFAEDQF